MFASRGTIYPGLGVPQGWPLAARAVGAVFAPTGPLRPTWPVALMYLGLCFFSSACGRWVMGVHKPACGRLAPIRKDGGLILGVGLLRVILVILLKDIF